MLVWTSMMTMQLKTLETSFLDKKDFLEYIAAKELITASKDQEQLKIIESDIFFKIALKAEKKYFNQWKTIKVLPLSIAGDQRTATIVACCMTGKNNVPAD